MLTPLPDLGELLVNKLIVVILCSRVVFMDELTEGSDVTVSGSRASVTWSSKG